jgi:hypothetical protein
VRCIYTPADELSDSESDSDSDDEGPSSQLQDNLDKTLEEVNVVDDIIIEVVDPIMKAFVTIMHRSGTRASSAYLAGVKRFITQDTRSTVVDSDDDLDVVPLDEDGNPIKKKEEAIDIVFVEDL